MASAALAHAVEKRVHQKSETTASASESGVAGRRGGNKEEGGERDGGDGRLLL
jgi:nicotinamide mononucleotide (NMN) deamidase PncC